MFWDIFLLAFGILMSLAFISNWRDSQKNDPISDELKFLIENTLIPLKKEIQEEYNPDAIVFAKVNEADPMPDLKDKDNISACSPSCGRNSISCSRHVFSSACYQYICVSGFDDLCSQFDGSET